MEGFYSERFNSSIPNISEFLMSAIQRSMRTKYLTLLATEEEGKFLAMDTDDNVFYKFDVTCSASGFNCTVLSRECGDPTRPLISLRSFNIAWTDGVSIREFKSFVDELPPAKMTGIRRQENSAVQRKVPHFHPNIKDTPSGRPSRP